MNIEELPKGKKIILFDGICNLCDALVCFIIKHDKKDVFRFVSLQSELGQTIVKNIELNSQTIDNIVLYDSDKAYYHKSQAILKIADELGGFFSLFSIATILPTSFLDVFYDYVAKNRYQWYGKKESCLILTSELKAKFLA
jgi:predicted DCC family thiol-disulfide oxidoreductase YuxK